MPICKHKNGILVEIMEATHTRYVRNGVMQDFGFNDMGNIQGYAFRCEECGKSFKASSGITSRYKWLGDLINLL